MISFNNLGNLGRLANQMFQYASLKGIASHHGYDFCIPPKEIFGVFDINVRNDNSCLYNVFDLEGKNIIQTSQNPVLQERVFHFDEELFNNCPNNIDLLGYFQTEKYFKHIEGEIRKDFTFNEMIVSDCRQFYNTYFPNTEVISLHIRRGDYLVNPNHPVQSMEYYKDALLNFDDTIPVIVFSDDHEWCISQELFSDDRFFISQGEDAIIDLCIMSICDYHIIANSSYSWWGAWLAKSKKVIAPKEWFGGEIKHTKYPKDLYCNGWIIQ